MSKQPDRERSTLERLASTGQVYRVDGGRMTDMRQDHLPPSQDLLGPDCYLALTFTNSCSGPFMLRNSAVRAHWRAHWAAYIQDCPIDFTIAEGAPEELGSLWVRLDQEIPAAMLDASAHIRRANGLVDLDRYGCTFDRHRAYTGNIAPPWQAWKQLLVRSVFRLGFTKAAEDDQRPEFAHTPETILDGLALNGPLTDSWKATWDALRFAQGSTAQHEVFRTRFEQVGAEAYACFRSWYPDARMEITPSYTMLRWLHERGMEMSGHAMHPQFRAVLDEAASESA